MELPGLVAVRWRRSHGAALVGPREGAEPCATDGLAPLPAIRREGSPPRRKVARSADDIALPTSRLELSAGKLPIADQGFVLCQLRRGSLEQACLSGGVARLGRRAPDEETGDGPTLRSDRPNARGAAQRHGRYRLPCCGRVVRGRTVLEAGTAEADEVTGHRTLAPILVGAQGLFLPDELLPGLAPLRRVPLAIRECRPGTPDGLLGQPQRGQPGDHGSSAQEEATTEEHPEERQEAESGANGHTLDHMRQDSVHPID